MGPGSLATVLARIGWRTHVIEDLARNLRLSDPSVSFTRVDFIGWVFEFNNVTTSSTYYNPTAAVPEPGTWAAAALLAGGAAFMRWRKRARIS